MDYDQQEIFTTWQLSEFGVKNYTCDWSFHVGYNVGKMFMFPSKNALEAEFEREYVPAKDKNGNVTSLGRLVRPNKIEGLKAFDIPTNIISSYEDAVKSKDTSILGKVALDIVMDIQKMHGRYPLKATNWEIVEDKERQILGWDIVLDNGLKIQVKFDRRAGWKAWTDCTGNLYIETHERNYDKKY